MIACDGKTSLREANSHYIARQPILDRAGATFGYELLYRQDEAQNILDGDGDRATMRVIQSLFSGRGVGSILAGRSGFINCTRYTIKSGLYEVIPKDNVVLEILEDILYDTSFIDSCRDAQAKGYKIALDDFVLRQETIPLLEIADYVKVDFLDTDIHSIYNLATLKEKHGFSLIAEKVEDEKAFDFASECGYDYFQGYYFCQPESTPSQTVSALRDTEIRLLAEVSKPAPSIESITQIIKMDPVFSYRLLKYVNSSYFSFLSKIGSIKQAVLLLGPKKIRYWITASVLAMATLARPPEVLRMLLVRAHFLQNLAARIGLPPEEADELYLVGIFSLLHIALGCSIRSLLKELPLTYEIKSTLTGGRTRYSDYLKIIEHIEKGEWEQVDRFGLPRESISASYQESLLTEFTFDI